jgi:hypothetical protein
MRGSYPADECDPLQTITICALADATRRRIVDGFKAHALNMARRVGSDPKQLRVAFVSVMVSAPGKGAQPIHFDQSDFHTAKNMWTILLYCCETDSTFVLKEQYTQADTDECYAAGEGLPPKRLRDLCSYKNLVNFPVETGTSLVLNGATLHAAPDSPGKGDRVVALLLLADKSLPAFDTNASRFPRGITDN